MSAERTEILVIGSTPGRLTGVRAGDKLEITTVTRVGNWDAALELLRWTEGPILVEGATLLQSMSAERNAQGDADGPRVVLAEVLHDIRQALLVIGGYAEVLQRQTQPSAKTKTYVERIIRNSTDLQTLLEELLDVLRAEAGKLSLNLSDVVLSDQLGHVMRAYELQAQAKGLSLEAEVVGVTSVVVRTDALRLRRMIGNMVANAIQYTEQGSVRVEMGYSQGMLTVMVKDTGPGIPVEYREAIFEPFGRGGIENLPGKRGTGLGLSAVRRMARLMGGDVELVRSHPTGGSVFRLTVRADQAAAQ